MIVFENINSKNIDEFAEWLVEHCVSDGSLWDGWYDRTYCKKCEPIVVRGEDDFHKDLEYCWCELNGDKCKFFQDMKEIPGGKQLVKMWLESESE